MIEIIKARLESYVVQNPVAEEQALKEIIQEIALFGLWQARFFDVAAFQGGTSLRILHKLPRFSEDLDFILKESQDKFDWTQYLNPMLDTLTNFGVQAEVSDKGTMDQRVRKAIIKDNSLTSQLDLSFYQGHSDQKLRIKLEIDIHPPAYSVFDYTYLNFPADFEVFHQDLPSNFSLKLHALLCRPYTKGRDWYDFTWYLRKNIKPNLPHLQAALNQYGPWQGQEIQIDLDWLREAFQQKITATNWNEAKADVDKFLLEQERQGLTLWNDRFFNAKLAELCS